MHGSNLTDNGILNPEAQTQTGMEAAFAAVCEDCPRVFFFALTDKQVERFISVHGEAGLAEYTLATDKLRLAAANAKKQQLPLGTYLGMLIEGDEG